ncbi:uncharacterized protein LOC143037723 [Oratosquilla oratoria]|uniref:uncharacterized protein LOC143037723 n=1 Tax=Oratosquilla oratoria TaxID=337810 RepID=UPI003F7682B7
MPLRLVIQVVARAILKYFGAPDIEPEGSSELPDQEAPGPSLSSGPPSFQEALGPLHISEPQEPVDPADWPPILPDSFRTDAVAKEHKLVTEGLTDWRNLGTFLKSHENSPEHTSYIATWKDLQLLLQTGKTIDQAERTLLEAEKRRWRDVLTRLISIIQSLAERNLAFRGLSNTLHQQNNGDVLKEVELLAKFDHVTKQHIEHVESGQFSHSSYLENIIQNELIASISGKILDTVVTEIKQSKYHSVILDCTPNVSHQEQMPVIIRTVKIDKAPEIKKTFYGISCSF